MKFIVAIFITAVALGAEYINPNRKNTAPVSSSSNPASGVSDGPLGPNEKEKQEVREKAKSMGGAPNMGGGMGTGTGPAKKNKR